MWTPLPVREKSPETRKCSRNCRPASRLLKVSTAKYEDGSLPKDIVNEVPDGSVARYSRMSSRSKNASAERPKRVLSLWKVNPTSGRASPELMSHNAPKSNMSGVSRAYHSCAVAGADMAAAIAAVATILKPGNRIAILQSVKSCRQIIDRRKRAHPPV